ncbi:MAG: hypothetical protein IT190_00380 [Microbacteriaceae bacterium]|nr:hypothetical protein [Microbacteriaceae bacterium]
MLSIQKRASHSRGSLTFRSSVAVVALAGLLVGCVPTGNGSADSAEPVEPAVPLGYEWTEVPFTTPLIPGTEYQGFSAGGAFWTYARETPTILYGTTDGKTWRTIDVTEYGALADTGKMSPDCGFVIAGDRASSTFTMVYHSYYGQGHPEAITEHIWMVEISPDDVTVSDGATNGLEVMPPDEGGTAYRTECVLGIEKLGDEKIVVGMGQWWAPYATGGKNPFVAKKVTPEKWEVHASSTESFFGDDSFPYRVTKAVDRVVMLVNYSDAESELAAWSSTDGMDWAYSELPGPKVYSLLGNPSVESNDYGIAAWTTPGIFGEGQSQLWSSVDGQTWKYSEPIEADWNLTTVRVDKNGFTAFAYKYESEKVLSMVRHSVDGETWTVVDDANPRPQLLERAIAHDGGLVLISDDMFLVSGLPWGAP